MKQKVYSIYDVKGEIYGNPFYAPNRGLGIRIFAEIAQDGRTTLCRFPDDFVLFEIGEFENTACSFTLLAAPIRIGSARDLSKVAPMSQPVDPRQLDLTKDLAAIEKIGQMHTLTHDEEHSSH